MATPELTNPWDEGGSLATDWGPDNAVVLDTPAVGDVPVEQVTAEKFSIQLLSPHEHKQDGAKCWAAALASWIPAQTAWDRDGKSPQMLDAMIYPDEIFKRYERFTDASGMLLPDNWPKVAKNEGMDWATMNGSKITPLYIYDLLKNKGYLYWASQPSSSFSHVRVIYAVYGTKKGSSGDGVHVMDPTQGRLNGVAFADIVNIPRNQIAWRGTGQQQPGP